MKQKERSNDASRVRYRVGKVVFITGAGRGIGKGIAQALAEAGADIALNALTPTYVEGTAAEIAAASCP